MKNFITIVLAVFAVALCLTTAYFINAGLVYLVCKIFGFHFRWLTVSIVFVVLFLLFGHIEVTIE